MRAEQLQDRAVQYVSGAMTAAERESFEVVLEFHRDLRLQVAELQEVASTVAMAPVGRLMDPPADLKSRLLGAVETLPPRREPDGLVVTDAEGRVEWINPAFTAMCGYSLEEIRGRKPGHLLQGPATDPAAVERIRAALRDRRPCREALVNYHKDGTRYRADVRISPVLDDDAQPLWFVARERRLPDDAAVVAG
jgi:PAS domain S-box-containing protein